MQDWRAFLRKGRHGAVSNRARSSSGSGNLGTILRTAEGAGATGRYPYKDCADLYQPKTIRSTMGAIYRMPAVIVEDLKATLGKMKECGIHTYAAHLDDSRFMMRRIIRRQLHF